MSVPIILKRSGVASAAPSTLSHGELALNYADGVVYWKDSSNTIRDFSLIAGVPSSPSITGNATFTASAGVPVTITNTGTANSFVVNDASGDASPFVINDSGRVGIGTTSPDSSLHVLGGQIWQSNTDFALGSTGTVLVMYTGASTGNTFGAIGALPSGGSAWGDLVLQEGGGKVGIGTTSPSTSLDVRGAGLFYRTTSDGLVTVQGLQTSSGGTGKAALQIDVNGQGGFAWQCDATSGKTLRLINNNGYGAGESTLLTVTSAGVLAVGGNTVLHAGNYNSYSPTLTGGGASGTWGISVSGELTGTAIGLGYSLSTATVAYAGHAGPQVRSQGGGAAVISFHRPGAYAVNFGLDTDNQLKVGGWSLGANSYVLLSSANYNSYSPTLTGGGASGTWSINVAGTAGSISGFGNPTADATANTIAYRNGNGDTTFRYVLSQYLNMSHAAVNRNADTVFYSSTDDYLRKNTSSGMRSSLNVPTRTGGDASGTWSISITGNAGSSTYSTYQTGSGTANNFNTNFTETPAHNRAFREMSAGGPQGAWWFCENLRHSNASNYWGRQNAWGWEDNANELWSRNVQNGVWGSWVRFIHSGNYNSYAPTLTGGGASGTWGINVTGTAASETLATVCSRGVNASAYGPTFDTVYTGNWFRSNGNSGWYSQTHGGGIWMTDSTWVRVYNNKQFYADNIIQSGASVRAPIFYDSQDTAYYCDPNGTSRMASMDIDSLQIYGNHLYVGKSDTAAYSYIHMRDSDEGERQIHCNSNRIGFMNQSGGWGSWCYDDGSWACYGGANRALEVIGGWGQYGGAMEVRTDSNGAGTQDGPKIFFHKAAAKYWSAGIEPYGSHGFSIWEDGSTIGWGTQRFKIAVGGEVSFASTSVSAAGDFTNKSRPAYFVRAWIRMSGGNPVTTQASGNVSSVNFLNTGRFQLNFTTPIPNNSALVGSCSNGDTNTLLNTSVRAGSWSVISVPVAGISAFQFSTIQAGGQGVPGFQNLSSTHVVLIG
jgi:hypothetical protein